MTRRPGTPGLGYALVLVSAWSYAVLPILLKLTWQRAPGWPPMEVVTWRFVLAAPLAWALVALTDGRSLGRTLRDGWPMGLVGLIFVGNASATFAGLARVPASVFALLFSLYPAVVALTSWALGQRLSRRSWGALALALLGCGLTTGGRLSGEIDPIGAALCLAATLCYALYIQVSSRVQRGGSGLSVAAWSITGTAAGLLLLAAARGGLPPPPGPLGWGAAVALAAVCSILPIGTFLAGMVHIGPTRAAVLSTFEPVGTLLLASLFLGESIAGVQYVGGVAILASVVILATEGSNEQARQG